jgi:hypothetical protein
LPAATVLVMGSWSVTAALAERLGEERARALAALLRDRALAAAEAVGPGAVQSLGDGDVQGLAGGDVRRLAGEDVRGALTKAAADGLWPLSDEPGPLLILWPGLARWRPAHVDAALADLADGCDLAVGPVFDGGFYLLGLAHPMPSLLELADGAGRSPDALAMTLALAARGRVEAGLLRAERALRTPADVAAALADPLLDNELRGLLAG